MQHGSKTQPFTVTELHTLNNTVAKGFNQMDAHKIQTYSICMALILPIHEHLQLHASQYKQKTQHPLHKHTTFFNTRRLKKLSSATAATPNIPTDLHTFPTTDIYIHLLSLGIYPQEAIIKILRTPPPHISSSEEILPRLTRRTLSQLRTNKSPFLK